MAKPYKQFRALPKKSRERVIKAVIRQTPDLVLKLVTAESRRLTKQRSGVQNAIRATLNEGVKIALPDDTVATIFRLDNPHLTHIYHALYEDRRKELGDGTVIFKSETIAQNDYHKHYVVRFENPHYTVDVICYMRNTITGLTRMLKRNERRMVYGLPLFVYNGKLYHSLTREGKLLAEALMNNRSPQIEALISDPEPSN
jgi:hypothetical protein